MAIPLTTTRDINGYMTTGSQTGRRPSDTAIYFTMNVTPGTVTSVTVPANSNPTFGSQRMVAYFRFADPLRGNPAVWVQPSASPTITLPSATVASTTAELNPIAWEVVPGQVLQFISPEAGDMVSIVFYAIQ